MARHYDKDAREMLAEIAHGKTDEEYREIIWSLRYPKPFPKAGKGWPYKSKEAKPVIVRRGRAVFEVIKSAR